MKKKAKRIERSGTAKALGLFYEIGRLKKQSKTRKLPYLPRLGLVIDFAGYELTLKFAPFLEAVLSLPERGFSSQNLTDITAEQFDEIAFHSKDSQAVINTSAKSV